MPDTLRWSEMDARARDALVAEKIFGLIVKPAKDCAPPPGAQWLGEHDYFVLHENGNVLAGVPDYTTDMNAAWQVVESHKFMNVELEYTEGWHSDMERWQAYTCTVSPYDKPGVVSASWNTMPEAICIAALMCVGVTIEE